MVGFAFSRGGIRRLPVKVAVAAEGARIAVDFGRCSSFTLAEISEGKISGARSVESPGPPSSHLPGFLIELQVDCVIAGKMGARARKLFARHNVQRILGLEGDVAKVMELFARGRLKDGDHVDRLRSPERKGGAYA